VSVILTGLQGNNSDLIKNIADMYIQNGDVVADVTYGKGVFWAKTDTSSFTLLKSDKLTGTDFTDLPYGDTSIDVLVLDPPYMHGGETVKRSINDCYKNENTSHESVVRLYLRGMLEATRVLKKGGLLFVKSQDEIESGNQQWSHVELMDIGKQIGFKCVDLFVLLQSTIPTMRVKYQKTARKNHSYMLIFKFRR